MQNTQEINWWLEFFRIASPIAITLGVGFWLSTKTENYKSDLSKEIEDYKKDISKELETHKIQLQSDFQTNLYEFQTRFSLLQQKRAEVFTEIISMSFLLAKEIAIMENKKDAVEKLLQSYETFEGYYFKHRLYINMELKELIDDISCKFHELIMKTLKFLTTEKDKNIISDENSPFKVNILSEIEKLSDSLYLLEMKFIETLFPEEAAKKKLHKIQSQ